MRYLTVRERILLHARDADVKRGLARDVPVELTQAGIAEAIGISPRNASRYLAVLVTDGLLEARREHVLGLEAMRIAYFPTDRGRSEAERISRAASKLPGAAHLALPVKGPSTAIRPVPRGGGLRAGIPVDVEALGRDEEIQSLLSAFEGGARAVVIRGVAGAGKTTVAASVLARAPCAKNAVGFAFKPWSTALDLSREIAKPLAAGGLPALERACSRATLPDDRTLIGLLVRDLATLPDGITLFLDDFERAAPHTSAVIGALVEAAIEGSGRLRLLFASREPVGPITARHRGSGRVAELHLSALAPEAARALLARHGVPEARQAALADASGGHPLALVLGASNPEAAPRISGPVARFFREEVFSRLEPDAQNALNVLAVADRPLSVEALGDAGVPRGSIERLVERMLVVEDDDGALSLHDIVREAVAGRLGPADERIAHRALAAAYATRNARMPDLELALREIEHMTGAGLAAEVYEKLARIGHALARSGWSVELLRIFARLDRAPSDAFASEVFLVEASARRVVGDLPGARAAYHQAAASGGPARARALAGLGSVLYAEGRYAEAERTLEAALAATPDPPTASEVWGSLGCISLVGANPDDAATRYRRSLDLARESGEAGMLIGALDALGVVHTYAGRFVEAEAAFREGELLSSQTSDPEIVGKLRHNLGECLLASERPEEAAKTFEANLATLEDAGVFRVAAYSRLGLARALVESGRFVEARELASRAEADLSRLGEPGERALAAAVVESADIATRTSRGPSAEILAALDSVGPYHAGRGLAAMGLALLAHDRVAAVDLLERARVLLGKANSRDLSARLERARNG